MTKNHLCVYPINWADQLNLLWGNMNGAQCCHLLLPLNELCKHFYDYLVFFLCSFFINFATLYPTAYTAHGQKHADTSRRGNRCIQTTLCWGRFLFFFPMRHVHHMCRYPDTESSTTRIYILWHPQITMLLLIYLLFFCAYKILLRASTDIMFPETRWKSWSCCAFFLLLSLFFLFFFLNIRYNRTLYQEGEK